MARPVWAAIADVNFSYISLISLICKFFDSEDGNMRGFILQRDLRK